VLLGVKKFCEFRRKDRRRLHAAAAIIIIIIGTSATCISHYFSLSPV
jgi:hypothetical protein